MSDFHNQNDPNQPPPSGRFGTAILIFLAIFVFIGFWFLVLSSGGLSPRNQYDFARAQSHGFVGFILFVFTFMILIGVIKSITAGADRVDQEWRERRDRQVKLEQEQAARAQERQRELHNQEVHRLYDLKRQAAELKQQADAAEARARPVAS